jgi:hypothetical protein
VLFLFSSCAHTRIARMSEGPASSFALHFLLFAVPLPFVVIPSERSDEGYLFGF